MRSNEPSVCKSQNDQRMERNVMKEAMEGVEESTGRAFHTALAVVAA